MKKYDLIAIGTGSAMNFIETLLRWDPDIKIAVIDKDDPGGICLTRGCIPTKILVYPAEVIRTLERARNLGIEVSIRRIDFQGIMNRMQSGIQKEVREIGKSLTESENIDYYHGVAEFTGPYRLKVGDKNLTSELIFLCLGSRPLIPAVKGLAKVQYYTSDTILDIKTPPARLTILGGGYIAAEYGHFFSAMGSKVTILGRNPQFLPQEEPEVSELAKSEMSQHLDILTNHEVREVRLASSGQKEIIAMDREQKKVKRVFSDEILLATGRASNSDILHPERAKIETDERGWIRVNEYLETSASNIWAFGDANGRHLFKHVANYESKVVFYNAVLKEKVKVDYHAVPHAVFSHPEIAAVGLRQLDAVRRYGEDGLLIGFRRYHDTAKGEAMGVRDYFVKVIVTKESEKILGAHIVGPQASVLIQEIINLMYSGDQTTKPVMEGMHIHPSLSEVVQGAFTSLMPPNQYDQLLDAGAI
jgi:dihydrolipoamide dehydrogenase